MEKKDETVDEILDVILVREEELAAQFVRLINMKKEIQVQISDVEQKIDSTRRALVLYKNPELVLKTKVIDIKAEA